MAKVFIFDKDGNRIARLRFTLSRNGTPWRHVWGKRDNPTRNPAGRARYSRWQRSTALSLLRSMAWIQLTQLCMLSAQPSRRRFMRSCAG